MTADDGVMAAAMPSDRTATWRSANAMLFRVAASWSRSSPIATATSGTPTMTSGCPPLPIRCSLLRRDHESAGPFEQCVGAGVASAGTKPGIGRGPPYRNSSHCRCVTSALISPTAWRVGSDRRSELSTSVPRATRADADVLDAGRTYATVSGRCCPPSRRRAAAAGPRRRWSSYEDVSSRVSVQDGATGSIRS